MSAQLLGDDILTLARVRLSFGEDPGGDSPKSALLDDILVLTMASGRQFELLVRQGEHVWTELSPEMPIPLDFELESHGTVSLDPIASSDVALPFRIGGMTEYWAGNEGEAFLVGCIFFDERDCPRLCLYLTADAIEIIKEETLHSRLDLISDQYGPLSAIPVR